MLNKKGIALLIQKPVNVFTYATDLKKADKHQTIKKWRII